MIELRILKYFLMVAKEENITKAANLLHLTQPTLSRQLMQLEKELGVKLFTRSRHRIILTDDGMLLKRRAQEIVALTEKTEQEFFRQEDNLIGEISIGCGETQSMSFLSQTIRTFREKYPLVTFSIYSAVADDVKDRIEKGILDIGLLVEPVDISKYEVKRLPKKERWGVLVPQDWELAAKEEIQPEDLLSVPLIIPTRELVKNRLANWFSDYYEQLEIAATYNLVTNAAVMVQNKVGVSFCFESAQVRDGLKYIPLIPKLETGSVLVWKRHQAFSQATTQFIKYLKIPVENP